jgi:hypothetical protein
MPRSRSGAVTTDGHSVVRVPGAYWHALEKKCELDAMIAARDYLTLDDADIPEWERENAERKAALIRERDGQPVRVQTYMLPDGLPPPFDRWPQGGGKGSFVVMPDDTITFNPREART